MSPPLTFITTGILFWIACLWYSCGQTRFCCVPWPNAAEWSKDGHWNSDLWTKHKHLVDTIGRHASLDHYTSSCVFNSVYVVRYSSPTRRLIKIQSWSPLVQVFFILEVQALMGAFSLLQRSCGQVRRSFSAILKRFADKVWVLMIRSLISIY